MNERIAKRTQSEEGVTLIVALVFLLAIGMVISAIASFASTAFMTSYNLGAQRSLEANAESAVTMAIENVRYTFYSFSSPTNCMPSQGIYPAAAGSPNRIAVFCASEPSSAQVRIVNFSACSVPSAATIPYTGSACSAPVLFATVSIDDLPPGAASSACNSSTNQTCGEALTITLWDVRTADN